MKYKLGSLFDGSGGFPLAGSLCDIEPVWAAEVEPYPVAVTRSRFPNMKHYGDVSKINGAEVEPVNILTFGAPCQDLSVAGLRKGLRHTDNGDEETTRSGLFMEAVRIIKEMREATNGRYPDFAVYENVPGAFSSSGGEDWRTVLQSLIQIVEPGAVVPDVPKGGWAYADWFMGCGWSLAYRVLDAQYWGVPQRRRRIYLVLDLRGERAGKILFEREGLRGYFAQGGTPWQAAAGDAEAGAGADDREGASAAHGGAESEAERGACHDAERSGGTAQAVDGSRPRMVGETELRGGRGLDAVGCDLYNLAVSGDVAVSLTANTGTSCTHSGPTVAIPCTPEPVPNLLLDDQGGSQISYRTDDKAPTLRAEAHGNVPAVVCYDAMGNGDGQTANTITGDHENRITDYTSVVVEQTPVYCIDGDKIGKAERAGGSGLGIRPGDKMYTLTAKDAGSHAVAYGISSYDSNAMKSSNPHSGIYEATTSRTLDLNGGNPACNQGGIAVVEPQFQTYQKVSGPLMANSHPGSYTGQDAFSDMLVAGREVGTFQNTGIGWWNESPVGATVRTPCGGDATLANVCVEVQGMDCRNGELNGDLCGTLQAKPGGGFSYNCIHPVILKTPVRYIVRRLTPTECARLQGFPDKWGHPDRKDSLTDEEYRFWLDVRNTHAAINGKPVKEYTREQMLKWYNGLHTDSAEYKMWGNGIALPCALYVMQGIEDALKEEELWT